MIRGYQKQGCGERCTVNCRESTPLKVVFILRQMTCAS